MSYLLEALGRGLLGQLADAFETQLPSARPEQEIIDDARPSPGGSVQAGMRMGMSYLRSLRLADARRTFEQLLELTPNKLQPALGLACVYDELGQNQESLRFLTMAQAHDPLDPSIAFALGYCLERAGNTDAAVASYRRSIELCPRLRNGYERLAAVEIQQRRFQEAIFWYERLVDLEPGDLDILLTLGSLHLQLGESDHGIERFQRALLVEPDATDDADESLRRLSDTDDALATMECVVERYPGVAEFRLKLGDLYRKAGQPDRAIEEYQTAVELEPNLLEASVKYGTQLLRMGRYADAAQQFNRSVELNDRLMTAFVGLGVAQHEAGRKQEALATFDLAASLEPNTTLLYSEAARLQFRAESNDSDAVEDEDGLEIVDAHEADEATDETDFLHETIRRHEQVLLNKPQYADLHYRHGLLLRQVGRYREAIQAFRNALTINPNYLKALIKLGVCLKEAGDEDDAIQMFRRALMLDTNFVDVHYQLGLLFAQRSQFDLAVEHFEHAVAGNSSNLAFRQNLALALQNIGMVDRAAETWRSICELSRDTAPVMQRRESVLRKLMKS
ncbi:MAG: tetratricopeptide repeat protein [Phycisphaerales bacterium]|nr:tetratricopeptide repeat protein [Phycisphaerales bacterium]